jgi:hypothetical protein
VQEKEDTKPHQDVKLSHVASGIDSSTSTQTAETKLADLLDSTLWNRRLAPSSERIVYGLVQQIFHGIREYFLVSTELKVRNVSCLFMYICIFMCLVCKFTPFPLKAEAWQSECRNEALNV